MESKFDWVTLTVKPEKEDISFWDTYHMLEDKLLLKDLLKKMVHVGRISHYEECLGYENITLCLPSSSRFREQGFCLRISSQGLDFFKRYLDTYLNRGLLALQCSELRKIEILRNRVEGIPNYKFLSRCSLTPHILTGF